MISTHDKVNLFSAGGGGVFVYATTYIPVFIFCEEFRYHGTRFNVLLYAKHGKKTMNKGTTKALAAFMDDLVSTQTKEKVFN